MRRQISLVRQMSPSESRAGRQIVRSRRRRATRAIRPPLNSNRLCGGGARVTSFLSFDLRLLLMDELALPLAPLGATIWRRAIGQIETLRRRLNSMAGSGAFAKLQRSPQRPVCALSAANWLSTSSAACFAAADSVGGDLAIVCAVAAANLLMTIFVAPPSRMCVRASACFRLRLLAAQL